MALPQVGQVFGRYRIDDLIGRGGMGVVLGATDTGLGRRVALKVVAADLGGAEEFRTRFEREAATLARLASPHVIAIYDYGTQDDCPYIATQYVAGGDLGAYLHDRGPMSPGEALRVCSQVADALDDAHRAGIVHRDVKPTNVLVRDRESDETYVYLCDFGIARDGTDGLTAPGAVAGTWSYLSPENGRGAPASTSSDLYAVGCLLWATLTGFPPYRGTDVAIALAHQRDPIPQLPGDSALVRAVNAILTRAMAKEAIDRYPDAGSLRDALLAAAALPGADGPAIPVAQADPTVWPHTGVRAATPASTPTPQAPSSAPPQRPPSYPPSYPPAPAYAPQHRPPTPTPTPTPLAPPRQGRGRVVAAIVGVLVLVGGGVTAVLLTGGDDDPDPGPTAGPTSTDDLTSGGTTEPDPSSPPTTEVPDGPITGDLDGDGIGDLSMDYDPAEGPGLLTTTWMSDGKTFLDPQTSDLGPRSGQLTWRVSGHLDDDDTEDVVTFTRAGEKAPDVTVSGTLSGGGSVSGELAGAASDNDAFADIDGDGVDELLNLEVKGQRKIAMTTRAFDGTTFGAARKSFTFTDDIDRFAIWPGDYDGDDKVDIATFVLTGSYDRGYPGTVEVRLGDGSGGFAEPVSAPFTSTGSDLDMGSGDFDADGSDELLIADQDTRLVVLNLFDVEDGSITPRGNAGSLRFVNTAPLDVAVVDTNGDGVDDVVSVGLVRPGGTARVLVGVSNTSTFTSSRWLAWDQLFAAKTNNDDDRFEVLEDTRW